MRKVILRNFQSPGDIVMLTAAVRDLHLRNPGAFRTAVRTPCPALWEHNPHVSPVSDNDPEATVVDCEYPLIHRSNSEPWHFLHGFAQHLGAALGADATPTAFHGDIHLAPEETRWTSQVGELLGREVPYWIVVAGGKRDFTAKWWARERYQRVVDHYAGNVLFVQVGSTEHEHPPLAGVVDLRGKTDLRQLVRLVHHAQGVLCPVTLAMHLAAAVPTRPDRPPHRACVVVAGGREPPHWEAYPHHQYLHRAGALRCCDAGGCWKSRVRPLGDGSEQDAPDKLCSDVVNELPRCLDLVSADDVIRAVELYYEGGALRYLDRTEADLVARAVHAPAGA